MKGQNHVDKEYQLEKFPGKGGWTYALIPEIPSSGKIPFGWVTINGSIDGYPLVKYKLMPFGNGQLFLPVRADIRKKIKKQAGDMVHIIAEVDNTPLTIPDEIYECFDNEPKQVKAFFETLNESEQKAYIDWIYGAKTEDKRAERIVTMMDKLLAGKKLYDR